MLNRLAFSGILPCVLHQNALHLAPKRTVFCRKLHTILLQNTQKLVQIPVLWNINSLFHIGVLTPFCIKTNLRENRFFAARLAIGEQEGHLSC